MDIGVDGPILPQKITKAPWDNYIHGNSLFYDVRAILLQFYNHQYNESE